ncbi:MAG: serine hydrolase [Pseudomonadota bacterium]
MRKAMHNVMKNTGRHLRAAVLAALALVTHMPNQADAQMQVDMPSPEQAITRLFTDPQIVPEWFTDAFIAAVPTPRIRTLVDGFTSDFGGFVSVHLTDGSGFVRLENAAIPVEITLDASGRIAGLLFKPPEPIGQTARDVADAILQAAPGKVAIVAAVQAGDGTWALEVDHNADGAMAVGSAFKLAVLRAYEDAVAAGQLARSDIAVLDAEDISLPSGVLQTLRPGTPITLETLVALMIQHSDNTATDALIRMVGRDAIDAVSPRNAPFIKTAELFKLISTEHDARRSAFVSADTASRRAILDSLSALPLPPTATIGARATWSEAEWYFTAEELCRLLASLQDAPALNGRPNPIVAQDGWPWIGFKGGSAFGVLNLSAAGVTPDGRMVCAVVTINAQEAIEEERMALLFGSLFRSLTGRR